MDLEAKLILFQDPVKVKKAAETLTKPRPRLYAEIAWLPVKHSEEAEKICELLKSSEGNFGALDKLRQTQNLLDADELMPIAKCNVLATGLSRLPHHSSDEVAAWILEIAHAAEDIDAEKLREVINADRKVAGFPTAKLPHIEAEIQNLRDHYRQVMALALENLSADERAEALTRVVEPATDDEKPSPRLIDRLIDWYELDAKKSLEKHETKIGELDEKLRLAADENRPDSVLASLVSQLTDAINNWLAVAQPIQINKKIKGLLDEDSRRVAWRVRDLAIHLFNDYNKLSFCQQLVEILQAAFADVVEISELLANDMSELEKITGVRAPKVPNPTARRRERRARRDIEIQVQKLRATADADLDFILVLEINSLIQSVKNWKVLAQPTEAHHAGYSNVANLVRELALYLWKERGELDSARQLFEMLQEEFAKVSEITTLLAEDLKALEAPERARLGVQAQAEKLRAAADAKKPDSILSPMVNQLIHSVKKWKALAQPFESYRTDHYNVANLVRELALYFRTEHGKLEFFRQLMKMLQEVFAEIGKITTLIAEDIKALKAQEHAGQEINLQVVRLRAAADAKNPDSILIPMVNQLIQSVEKWKTLAQPIKAYNADYHNVANLVRELALYLWKEHGKPDFARQLFKMLQEEFADVDQIVTLIAEDIKALEAPERARRDFQVQAEKLRAAADAKHDDSNLSQMVNQLIQSAKEWKSLAQPFKAYRSDYNYISNLVRELALHLWHEHGKLDFSRQLFKTLQVEFAEAGEIAVLIAKHLDALEAPERARLDVQVQAEKLRAAADAKKPDSTLSSMVNQLIQSLEAWKTLAQPIKAYCADYHNVANLVRKLALHLRNEHGNLNCSHQLLMMLQEVFAEISEITTLIAKDIKALEAPERARLDVQEQAEKLRAAADAKKPDSTLIPMVSQLIQCVKDWNTLAQPFKAYYSDYHNVANLVRELALQLRNELRKPNSSHKLTEMIQELFAEVGEIATLIREDAKSLDEAIEQYVRPIAKERADPPEGMIEAIIIGILMALLLVALSYTI